MQTNRIQHFCEKSTEKREQVHLTVSKGNLDI